MLTYLIDLLIGVMILLLAIMTLFSKDKRQATIGFILFGLFMALAYIRLNAPDVALTEAAVGAGVTGALLLKTLSIIDRLKKKRDSK